MRRKRTAAKPAATATATAASVGVLPYEATMSYRDYIKDVLPVIAPHIEKSWEYDWMGVYKSGKEFIEHLNKFGGALPRIQELYKPSEMNIPASPTHELTFVRDTYGEVLDTDAYMAGEAECFITIQPAEVQKSNLTMRVIHGMSANVDAREAVDKYMKLADLYTAALSKYNVRVIFEWGGALDNGKSYMYKLIVSDFGQPLDPYTLVSALSSPMYRANLRGLARTLYGGMTNVSWHREHTPYLNKPSVQRKDDEIIISPMFGGDSFRQWELENMLKAAGLTEDGQ